MAATALFLLPALVLAATVAEARFLECAPHRFNTLHAQAITDFNMAVNRYAEIHRLLANPLSALANADLEQAARARRAHRAAILEAHGALQRGGVFTPRVAAHFRCQIELAKRHAGTAIVDMWPAVLLALPELPPELEYQLVDRNLVLLDPDLNLVVDVLEAAFPLEWAEDEDLDIEESETCAPVELPVVVGSPCDAHSELEICWS
jgi:hypothetical protein